MCVKIHFLKNDRGHDSWTHFAFIWDTLRGLEDVFDQPLFLLWISASTFESHPGDGVPEACGVLSASLAFPEDMQGLDAGGPAQESSGSETTEGLLSWEETHRWKAAQRGEALN